MSIIQSVAHLDTWTGHEEEEGGRGSGGGGGVNRALTVLNDT